MGRLRRAVHRLDEAGIRLWFGRLTGATLGRVRSPKPPSAAAGTAKDVKDVVTEYEKMRTALRQDADLASLDDLTRERRIEERLALFADPRRNEMTVRWDMIEQPPDILVTNFSMLNAMLMREAEERLFEQTRSWLASSPSNVFTLVVDELHLQRGTSGSETAMVVRSLLMRLGLTADSSQLRIIATSASLASDGSGGQFLEEFFGVERASFQVAPGEPRPLSAPVQLDASQVSGAASLSELGSALGVSDTIAAACYAAGDPGRLRATAAPEVAARLFGAPDTAALGALLSLLAEAGDVEKTQIRAHLFVRTMRGLWACVNRDCSGIVRSTEASTSDRVVGKLFVRPRTTCDSCQSRVLELLYCYECGDVSLGGFADSIDGDEHLASTSPRVPEKNPQLVFKRNRSDYRWFWPAAGRSPGSELTFSAGGWEHNYTRASLEPMTGRLDVGQSEGIAGWVVEPKPRKGHDARVLPALPDRCPSCAQVGRVSGQDKEQFGRGTVRTPIRAHTAGASAAIQVYLGEFIRQMKSSGDGRTLIFTDSRDDAARTSAGVALNHYRDLVRQLVRQALGQETRHVVEIMLDAGAHKPLSASETAILENAKLTHPEVWNAAIVASAMTVAGAPVPADQQAVLDLARTDLASTNSRDWSELLAGLSEGLVAMGANPAGPGRSLKELNGNAWFRHYTPPGPNLWDELPFAAAEAGRRALTQRMTIGVAEAVFDRARRDIESIGVGFVDTIAAPRPFPGASAASSREALRSVIRLLGWAKRYSDGTQIGLVSPPRAVSAYLRKFAAANGSPDDVAAAREWAYSSLSSLG